MKIYGVSGLGADKRVFNSLNIEYEFESLDWIEPLMNESIESYSKRLSSQIDTKNDFCIIGVSFGGLIAIEISKILNAKKTILISSAQTKYELPNIFRLFGKTQLIKIIPKSLLAPPRLVAKFLFGAYNDKLLNEILDDTDLAFTKWAIEKLINWKNTTRLNNVLKINGTNDKLIPPKGNTKMRLIERGKHFMIVDRANEISKIINNEIKNVCKN